MSQQSEPRFKIDSLKSWNNSHKMCRTEELRPRAAPQLAFQDWLTAALLQTHTHFPVQFSCVLSIWHTRSRFWAAEPSNGVQSRSADSLRVPHWETSTLCADLRLAPITLKSPQLLCPACQTNGDVANNLLLCGSPVRYTDCCRLTQYCSCRTRLKACRLFLTCNHMHRDTENLTVIVNLVILLFI